MNPIDMEMEPGIWLNEREERGRGDCGCMLVREFRHSLDPCICFCQTHNAAPTLLAACKRLLADWEEGKNLSEAAQSIQAAVLLAEGGE